MNKLLIRLCAILLLAVACIQLNAQNTKITLLNKLSNEPIQHANVCWESTGNAKAKGFCISDNNGIAELSTNAENVVMSVSCIGYKAFIDTVNLKVPLKLYLEEDILNLDQVVVTGTRTPKRLADVPVQTVVIDKAEIEKAGSVSPLEILQDYVPGIVSTGNAMGNNLKIKGLNSRYILFMVDGERLVSEGAGGNINLDQIDFNNIERIEVVNGAASALYGSNAVGAVINIITKKATHNFEGGATYSLQSYNTNKQQLNVAGRNEKLSVRASAFRQHTDGYDILGGASSQPHTNLGSNLNFNFNPMKRMTTGISGRVFQHEVFNYEGTMNSEHDLERKLTLGAKASLLSKDTTNNILVSVNFDKFYKFDVMERKDDLLEPQNDITYVSTRILDTYSPNEKWETVGGVEFNYEAITTDSSKILGEVPTTKSVRDLNIFGQSQYSFTDDFDVVLGARYTYNEQFASAFSPKVSLMYKAGRFTFRGGTGTAFRAPSLKELYYNFNHNGSFWIYGNPELIAENGIYNSLSSEYTKSNFNVSLSGYYNHISDKITSYIITSDIGQPDQYYTNINSATLKGFDINIGYVLYSKIVLKGTYSFCDAKDNETGLQLGSNVRHSGTIATTWNGKIADSPFSLQLNGRITSSILMEYIEEDENGNDQLIDESSDPYNIWKLTFIKPIRFNEHLIELTLKCDNIFDFEDNYYTNPGRQYFVGLRYNFK